MALLSTGFSQSLQRTTPTVVFKGVAPNSFMSFAVSHCVGGEGGTVETSGRGELGMLSQEKGLDGPGIGLGLNFNVMAGGHCWRR